jgi:hypothetical protein
MVLYFQDRDKGKNLLPSHTTVHAGSAYGG